MSILEFVYLINTILLSIFGFHALVLSLYRYKRYKAPKEQEMLSDNECPTVTIQLPIYNERYVVERLIECAASFDYPQHKYNIQVLDDSTDDTSEIVRRVVSKYQAKGLEIEHIIKPDRKGYKAGALKLGHELAKGEFIAIFDADFLPNKDFLKRTIAYFKNGKNIGCVQTRWGHLNREFSWLTRAQAAGIDGHFIVEQESRSGLSLFLNFNGSAGIWRRECILDSGSWQHDTLTEDLDLSYRAQLKGWSIFYTPYVTAPAELPVHINAFKQQQFRWAKGSIQTARKLLWKLWKSHQPFLIKISGTLHLINYLVHPLVLLNLLLLLFFIPTNNRFLFWLPVFSLAAIGPVLMYWLAMQENRKNDDKQFLNLFILIILGIGMSYNNARGVMEAIFSIESQFKRTPKFNLQKSERFNLASDYHIVANTNHWIEACLAITAMILLVFAIIHRIWGSVIWMMLYACGYTYVTLKSFKPPNVG